MNAKAAEALYEAERKGVRQITHRLTDNNGGQCAMEVLLRAGEAQRTMLYESDQGDCPLCGLNMFLIPHFNDDHGLTFSEIARKLGPDSA